jgi:hypothetical protein
LGRVGTAPEGNPTRGAEAGFSAAASRDP